MLSMASLFSRKSRRRHGEVAGACALGRGDESCSCRGDETEAAIESEGRKLKEGRKEGRKEVEQGKGKEVEGREEGYEGRKEGRRKEVEGRKEIERRS
jgi:hypothetical protein